MIRREERGPVTLLGIERGRANAIDVQLLEELTSELARLDSGAAVVTGSGTMFSAGIDLPRLLEGGPDYTVRLLDGLDELLRTMIGCPRPIVAAINGHAIAGGFVLACACDFRVAGEGSAKVGLTEAIVGVPFPAAVLEVVRSAVGNRWLREMVYRGRLYSVAEAARRGLVDEVVAADELVERSVALASELAEIPRRAFELAKMQLSEPLRRRLERSGKRHDREVREAWVADETIAIVRRFVEEKLR